MAEAVAADWNTVLGGEAGDKIAVPVDKGTADVSSDVCIESDFGIHRVNLAHNAELKLCCGVDALESVSGEGCKAEPCDRLNSKVFLHLVLVVGL